jgi:hypothetical protein
MNKRIYHYTTLNSLKCILENKTIRLTALNKMDDLLEGMNPDFANVAENYYVSSWSESSEENIPLWYMYTDRMKGVRIEADFDFLELEEDEHSRVTNVTNPEAVIFKVRYDDSNNNFLTPVIYQDHLPSSITGARGYINKNIYDVGRVKPISWEFQKEIRFRLYGCSYKHLKRGESIFKRFMDLYVNKEIYTEVNEVDFIDLTFDIEKLKNANFVLGPAASEKDFIDLNNYINTVIPNYQGTVERSRLKIRFKEKS